MEALKKVSGIAAPFMRINIDTDQIIPALFLGGTDAKGYGAHLFHGWRFLSDGSPNPDFILNQAPYDRSQVLLADRNFESRQGPQTRTHLASPATVAASAIKGCIADARELI